jgi:hypothetical protein
MTPRLPLSGRARALVASAAAILGVVACRQLVGITDSPPEDLVTSICGLPYGTNVCASCVQASCCTESTTCAADPACAPYESCLGKCNGDPSCRSHCTIDNPGVTSSDISALSACLASNCETPCGLECGAIAPYVSSPDAAASCQTCVAKTPSNCASAKACGASAACDSYIRCYLACFTPDCRQACASSNAEGATLFASLQQDPNGPLTYFGGACSTPCGAGTDWACVGHVIWPSPKSPTVTLIGKIVDTQSGSPLSGGGGTESVCGGCPCPSESYPLVGEAGAPNDAGIWSVTLPNGVSLGTLGLDGCVQFNVPDSGYPSGFLYWGYPLSEPRVVAFDNPNDTTRASTMGALSDLVGGLGVTLDPTRAQVVEIEIHDCLGSAASGVSIAITPLGVTEPPPDDAQAPEYFNSIAVSPTPAGVTTTSTGVAGVFNFPPGVYVVTATPVSLGTKASQVTLFVQAGYVTGALMWPTPSQ